MSAIRGDTVILRDDPNVVHYYDGDIEPGAPLLVVEVFGDSLQVAFTDFTGYPTTDIVDGKDVKVVTRAPR